MSIQKRTPLTYDLVPCEVDVYVTFEGADAEEWNETWSAVISKVGVIEVMYGNGKEYRSMEELKDDSVVGYCVEPRHTVGVEVEKGG